MSHLDFPIYSGSKQQIDSFNRRLEYNASAVDKILNDPAASDADLARVEKLQAESEALLAKLERPQPRDKAGVNLGVASKPRVFGSADDARAFALFCGAIAGSRDAEIKYENLTGTSPFNVHNEGDNQAGGYLVPPQFVPSIIRILRDYGTFRAHAEVIEMSSDTLMVPRQTQELTTSYVGEGFPIPTTVATWDLVQLVLKKLAGIARISNELASDAVVNVADALANSFAYAIARQEDLAGWLGTGAAATGGIVGVMQRLIDSADAGCACVKTGTGAAWTNYTIADFADVIGMIHTSAHANAKWFVSPPFYGSVIARLAHAAGGTTLLDMERGFGRQFLGYPVVFVEVLPRSSAGSQYDAVFGDLAMSSIMGIGKGGLRLERSSSATVGGESVFERDQTALRMTSRYDIATHSVGSATEPSPIVAIRTV